MKRVAVREKAGMKDLENNDSGIYHYVKVTYYNVSDTYHYVISTLGNVPDTLRSMKSTLGNVPDILRSMKSTLGNDSGTLRSIKFIYHCMPEGFRKEPLTRKIVKNVYRNNPLLCQSREEGMGMSRKDQE